MTHTPGTVRLADGYNGDTRLFYAEPVAREGKARQGASDSLGTRK